MEGKMKTAQGTVTRKVSPKTLLGGQPKKDRRKNTFLAKAKGIKKIESRTERVVLREKPSGATKT